MINRAAVLSLTRDRGIQPGMNRLLAGLVRLVRTAYRLRTDLALENIALRQQLSVLKADKPRPKLTSFDQAFWILLRRAWPRWSEALIIVKPETVVRWHRAGFRLYWRRKSCNGKPGRPRVDSEFHQLIRRMASENPNWGAPRIH